MSEAELLTYIGALLGLGVRFGDPGAAYVTVAMTFIQLFFRFTNRCLGRGGGEIANRLLSGVSGLASAEAGLELWRLAAWARQQPRLSAALGDDGRRFRLARSALGRYRRGPRVLPSLATIHASPRPPCLRRDGRPQFALVRNSQPRACNAPQSPRPYHGHRRGGLPPAAGRRRAALANDCRRRLGNPFNILLFDFLFRRAQGGLALRENVRNEMARVMAALRRAFLELGGRLVRRGVLADREDIFFLELPELRPVVAGVSRSAAIAARKAEFAYYQTLSPPTVIVGQFEPQESSPGNPRPRPGCCGAWRQVRAWPPVRHAW